jgi:hypothetical protein
MLLVSVLWLLAAYHLITGAVALFAPASVPLMLRKLYDITIPPGESWEYASAIVGAFAVVIGGLAVTAARAPATHAPIVAALLTLQLCRVYCRLRYRALLGRAFGVRARANAAAVVVLLLESAVLAQAFL